MKRRHDPEYPREHFHLVGRLEPRHHHGQHDAGVVLPMMVTRLQSTNQVEMFSRIFGVMSPLHHRLDGQAFAEREVFSLRSCRRVCRRVGSRRAEARRNRSPRCLRGTMLPSSPPPTAAAPPRSCADPSGHRSADHRRGYRPQDSLSIQSTFPSIKRGGGRDDSHPNSLLTGKITGNFEKNANSPCHGGKGGPSNKEAEAKFHPSSYLSDNEWVVVSCGGSNQHHA